MIHPGYDRNLKVRPSNGAYARYYSVTFLFCLMNFVPLLFQPESVSDITVGIQTKMYLQVCYLMSLPLLFEFVLDSIAAQFQTLSALKDLEHRFGHGLLLFSLFLALFLVPGYLFQELSAFVVNTACAFLQAVVITGVFGKLQAHGNGHWKLSGCCAVIFLFVLSEVSSRFGMIYRDDDRAYSLCLALALTFLGLCFGCHYYLGKKLIAQLMGVKLGHADNVGSMSIDDIVCIILQAIISVYLMASFCSTAVFLALDRNVDDHTNVQIIKLLILALCCAILPGRMIRRSFILLKHELNTKESFVRYISHEIRSPLSTTSLGLDYLIERMNSDPTLTMAEALTVVQESKITCELAMNTLNDFLMLDKIQSNMVQISTVECAASSFMVNTVKSFRLLAMNNQVDLTYASQVIDGIDILNLPITVNVDQFKINQVIRNLFTNALKFTGAGGSISVTMSLRDTANGQEQISLLDRQRCMVRYSVTDTGCGISQENLPKLFGQYVQFDSAKLQGGKGSGLGLWLSKSIVELHGGRMGASSEGVGKGCTFWFEIPCEVTVLNNCIKRSGSSSVSSRTVVGLASSLTLDGDAANYGAFPESVSEEFDGVVNTEVSVMNIREDKYRLDSPEENESPTISGSVRLSPFPSSPISRKKTKVFSYKRSPGIYYSSHSETSVVVKSSGSGGRRFVRSGLRVLLVDDSTISRKFVERSLSKIEAECFHAENGREAVEIVRRSLENEDEGLKYDVILMDYYMPEMLGPAAIVAIRALGFTGVIIAVSGMASEDTEFNSLLEAHQINHIMQKPFSLDIFEAIVRGKIDQSNKIVVYSIADAVA